jgi:hypothetical protein
MGNNHSTNSRGEDHKYSNDASRYDKSTEDKSRDKNHAKEKRRDTRKQIDSRGRTHRPLLREGPKTGTNEHATKTFSGTNESAREFMSPEPKKYKSNSKWSEPGEKWQKEGPPPRKEFSGDELRAIQPEG